MEIWKDIKWYEWLYQISNLGNIKSLWRYKKNHSKLIYIKEKLLISSDRWDWYCRVNLYKEWKYKQYKTHRLVAIEFLENPNNKRTVNHIDWNPKNNKLENL